jgi:cation diffusion facilitator CzcD-associated flavoprotein CzcO
LESYADTLELNVWTSSTVTLTVFNQDTSLWDVKVVSHRTPDGEEKTTERIFHVKHVVFAVGFAAGDMPKIPGMESFKGDMMHSLAFKRPQDYLGKKAVVIGACTSGEFPSFPATTNGSSSYC